MATTRIIKRKIQAWKDSLLTITEKAVDQTKEKLLELNREQLMEGKNRFGQNLAPRYVDDPYFKTREAAQRYSDWKDKITPSIKRPSGVPNLYVVGVYHRSINVALQGPKLVFNSDFGAATDIETTYKGLYGLSAPFKAQYAPFLKPVFIKMSLDKLKSS